MSIPADLIDRARHVDILTTAERFVQLKRASVIERCGPCPVCGGVDRFSINVKKQVWHCRGCGTGGDVISLLQHAEEMTFAEAVASLAGEGWTAPKARRNRDRSIEDDKDQRRPPSDAWRLIWAEAQDPRRTLVEHHLALRGLSLPAEAAGEALRFHPRCPFGPGCTTPAIVALVRDIRSNEPIGIHRTALDSLGHKREIDGKDRMARGQIGGGAVKLTPDEEVTLGLGIGEGIETSLSLKLMSDWGDSPIWACLSAGALAAFPVLGGIETLVVAVDHDEAGSNAARQAIARWHEAGRETLAITPKRFGADLNDIVRPKG
jgi:putative DNA primase/helicase